MLAPGSVVNKVRVHVLARAARSVPAAASRVDSAGPPSILSLAATSFGVRPGEDTTIPTGFDPIAVVLFETIVEAAFVVANADGRFDDEERRIFERIVVEACDGAVSSHQIAALVSSLDRQLQRDGIDRRIAALAVGVSKREQAEEVLRIAALIAQASESVSDVEREVMTKLATSCGLAPGDVDWALAHAKKALIAASDEP
jgi:tellurite resistance protein